MKILHTSDWHIGRNLFTKKRYGEFEAFLDWLCSIIDQQRADALVIAGDIFDTGTPGNRAQSLYYRFLCRIASLSCRHVIVVGGNHDSPSFLNAPRELLRELNVHVVGCCCEKPEDEVVVLFDREGKPEAIVCTVPYLRDKDVRTVETGESADQKNLRMVEGVRDHYHQVCLSAEMKRKSLESTGGEKIPIIATGHLFIAGGKTIDGDGVRDLYVGSLAHLGSDILPGCVDYYALGHLHVPQIVGKKDHIRYCGSPLPMGFGEAKQQKLVLCVDFASGTPSIKEIAVPSFQKLQKVRGDLNTILTGLDQLVAAAESVWVEVEYIGDEIVTNLRESVENIVEGSPVEVLRIINRQITDRIIDRSHEHETLEELDPLVVFERCLLANEIAESEICSLKSCYTDILRTILEDESREEGDGR
ncbi:Exonuclease SbcD [Chitinispirillum alkaliphilum]|nr:Exonuclease SbcD [Chitinispirillum alkaliphilum]